MTNLSKFPYFVIAFVLSSLSTVDLALAITRSSHLLLSPTGFPHRVSPSLSPAKPPILVASLWDDLFGPGPRKPGGGTRGDSYCSLTFPAGRESKILGDRLFIGWYTQSGKKPVSHVGIEDMDSKTIVWEEPVAGKSHVWVKPPNSWQESKTYRIVFREADGSNMDNYPSRSPKFRLASLAERQKIQQAIKTLPLQEKAKYLHEQGFEAEAIAIIVEATQSWPQLEQELIEQECTSNSASKK